MNKLNEAMKEMYEMKKPTKEDWMMESPKAIKLSFDAVCDMAMMGATIGSCCEIMLNGVFVGEPIDIVNPEHNGGREVYEIDQETGVPTGRSIYVAYSDTYDVPHPTDCGLEINDNTAPDNNPIHEAIEFYWGKRCEDYEATCCVCEAWKQYDNLLSDSRAGVDDERLRERMRKMESMTTEEVHAALLEVTLMREEDK